MVEPTIRKCFAHIILEDANWTSEQDVDLGWTKMKFFILLTTTGT